jgi:transposase-like protein
MPRKKIKRSGKTRRVFTQEFKQEAVQMLFDGHSTASVSERLGVTANLLYRWKSEEIQ